MNKLTFDKKLTNISIRDKGDGRLHIAGLIPYNSISEDLGGYREIILPSAFTKSLNDGSEIFCLLNHDDSKVIGTTTNESLCLTSVEEGLSIECALPETSYAKDSYNLIKDGYVNGISFGFQILQHKIDNTDPENPVDSLIEVRLVEISFLVAFPAYPQASAQARKIDLDRLGEIVNKRKITDDDETILRSILKAIDNIIDKPIQTTKAAESTNAGIEFLNALNSRL